MPKAPVTAALAAAAAVMAAPAAALDPVPRTVAEAKLRMEDAERHTPAWPRHADPPGNVRAEDYDALFGGHVMVAEIFFRGDSRHDDVKIVFIGRNGRYEWCSFDAGTGRHGHRASRWNFLKARRAPGLTPVFTNGGPETAVEEHGWLSPLYDAATGEIIWYTPFGGAWWDWNSGHLQERLPAVTWTLCPGFPSADELGAGVNRAQTAGGYRALVAQDPGRRVLRPGLVTADPVEPVR